MVSMIRSKDDLSTRRGLSNICIRVCEDDLLELEDARLADLIDGVSIIADNCQARHEHPEFLRIEINLEREDQLKWYIQYTVK